MKRKQTCLPYWIATTLRLVNQTLNQPLLICVRAMAGEWADFVPPEILVSTQRQSDKNQRLAVA